MQTFVVALGFILILSRKKSCFENESHGFFSIPVKNEGKKQLKKGKRLCS